jgi:hypothetical protein
MEELMKNIITNQDGLKIAREEVWVDGGIGKQVQFRGLILGAFDRYTICPDSDTGTRPSELLVSDNETKRALIFVGGGNKLAVQIYPWGGGGERFLKNLHPLEINILSRVASGLPGRLWPNVEERLHSKWKDDAGGNFWLENIEQILNNIFENVDTAIRRKKMLTQIPIFGRRLGEHFYPII